MKLNRQNGASSLPLGAVLLVAVTSARADVGPPVEIRMSLDEMRQAVSGEEYAGVFEVHVHKAGTLADFKLLGDGWRLLSLETPGDPMSVRPGVVRIPFRAVPTDADGPIGLSLTYNGRRVAKSAAVGPAHFARADQPRLAIRVEGSGAEVPPDGEPASEPEDQSAISSGQTSGGRSTLRVEGRIMYYRSDMVPVGADHIDVRVWDNDDFGHDVIWEGHTDSNGYFDTGVVTPEDDPDGPDLIVYFETETANVVDVTDNSWEEWTYWWQTPEVENFSGSYYDFGWITVPSAEMPALHIFNSIVRTRRFITTWSPYQPAKVQVEWPDNSSDGGAWYEYYSDMAEIHLSTERQWMEDTHSHEYGHHFMHMYSFDPPDPDYCWDPSCDPDPAEEDCGHCLWCKETDHDAWNEGWPDWLADAVTRSLSWDYQFDDGTPYEPLFTRDLETRERCEDSDTFENPFETEGFVGALLRDIEDGVDLDGNSLNDDRDADGIMDSLCQGPGPMLNIQAVYDPITVTDFINAFRAEYPEDADDLWPTAYNVAPEYVSSFPPDTGPPGAVAYVSSPSHPLLTGGALPCIIFQWLPVDDDRGACFYSYDAAPTTVEPDDDPDFVTTNGCYLQGRSYRDLGQWWFSIKAQDCPDENGSPGNWGPTRTFGPFEVVDCNGSGYVDLCDIRCCDQACTAGPDYCTATYGPCLSGGCETSEDCNGNYVPDECDLAGGFSEDCNRNAIPDECENMFHWDGTSGSWHSPGNWLDGAVPTADSEVCIDVPDSPTVTYSTDSLQIGTLACSESLNIVGDSYPWAELTLNGASWIDGDLGLSGDHGLLEVSDRLDIEGMFNWIGSGTHANSATLEGPGVTYANGGVQIVDIVRLRGHLVLDGGSTSITTGELYSIGNSSVFEIRPGSTYEHQGSGHILSGFTGDMFDNDGTLIKSVDPGESVLSFPIDNSGMIHVQDGTLVLDRPCSSTGDFLGDPGTTLDFRSGVREFFPSSSIVADNVMFTRDTLIRGTYDVTTATTHTTYDPLTFTSEANIISYGSSFYAHGTVNFDAIVGRTIHFDTLSVRGTANFNSGDPVQVTNLIFAVGAIQGPSTVTVSTLLTWGGSYGTASFSGPGVLNVNGDMTIGAGNGLKRLSNRILNNAGTATFLSRLRLDASAAFNNLPSGVMDIQVDGELIDGSLNNAGTMVKSAGTGTSEVRAATSNTGTVEVQAGVLRLHTRYGDYYVQTAGQTVLNGGDLAFTNYGEPFDMQGGLLTGEGTITGDVANAGGTTAPGLSVGILDIDGDYTQATGGTLEIEIAGLTQASEYDLLTVSGVATLAGNLEVIISTNGFTPAPGDSFQILTAGSVGGEFDTVSATNLSPYLNMEVVYTTTDVTLDMVGVVPGDCNLDGDAALDDYADLKACLLGPGGGIGAECRCFDFDDNGDVNLVDFAEFQTAFTGS